MADLFLFVLALLLQSGNLAPFLLFQLRHFVEILGLHGLGDEIAEEDLLLRHLGLVEGVDLGQLRFLFVCQGSLGPVLIETFHGEFVGGFHALRKGGDCVLVIIMKTATTIRKWWIPRFHLLLMLGLAAGWVTPAGAEEIGRPVPLKLRLVSENTGIEPGTSFTVGIFLQHAPHHHSYYKFPGIVGVGTNITWELPEGFTASPLQWPTPERVDMRGHGAYGYHEDTLLLVEITPPAALSADKVTLKGRVGYMCCSQEWCTPGFEDVAVTLPVRGQGQELEEKRDSVWGPRFQKARACLPRALKGWRSEVEETESHFVLHVRVPEGIPAADWPKAAELYFFSWNGWTASDKPHTCRRTDEGYVFTMPKHPYPEEGATRFQGVVRSESGWPGGGDVMKGLWVDLPLEKEAPKS